jgi:hypothetical protein
MKFQWREVIVPPTTAAAEMAVMGGRLRFLVCKSSRGDWAVFHLNTDEPGKGFAHPCTGMAHGKQIAEQWARESAQ